MSKVEKILPEHVNPVTKLVPMKFLGMPDPENPEKRVGEAGLGLCVGETQGVPLKQAQFWLNNGLGELDLPAAPAKASKPAPKADA